MTRIANLAGRPHVVTEQGLVDLATAADLPADFSALYAEWDRLAPTLDGVTGPVVPAEPERPERLGSPSPTPGQVFGIGLNYRLHALESGLPLPDTPLVFTKFPSSVAGPTASIPVVTDQVDWEVEIAVVVGRAGRRISEERAWDHVAGLCLSQDVSARDVQMTPAGSPQFSLGKSFENFLPMGPYLVTPDELPDPDDVSLACALNGEQVQSSSTADLVFPVPELIARLSAVVELRPGDVVLTGTPSGVGLGRTPQRFLVPGDVLESSSLPMLGTMVNRCVPGSA